MSANSKLVEENPVIKCARKIALEFNCNDEEKILAVACFVREAIVEKLDHIKKVAGETSNDLYPLCR